MKLYLKNYFIKIIPFENITEAKIIPIRPPWNDIPPFQIKNISKGLEIK